MTHRTEAPTPSPIERATADVLESIRHNAIHFHRERGLANPAKGFSFTEADFLRVLALYFHDKTLAEWCRDLGIPDATDPDDKPSHGGEA
jgi:hypothetical protein